MATRFDFIEEDKRILEQRIRRHQISQPEYQKIIKNLPNDEDQVDEVPVYRDGDEIA